MTLACQDAEQYDFAGKVTGQKFGTSTTGPTIYLLRIEENLSVAVHSGPGSTSKTSPGLDVLNAMVMPAPSITWPHPTGRPSATA